MKSMTGYGKATVSRDCRELTIELKSVNHRFLDISTKIPRVFLPYEDLIRSGISKGISRGHIDVYLNYKHDGDSDKVVSCDMELAKSYYKAASEIKNEIPLLDNDLTVMSLMRMPDVLQVVQQEENDDILREMLTEAVFEAVDSLNVMREAEGNKLRADLLNKIDGLEKLVDKVKIYAPTVVEQYRDKLRQRIAEALECAVDENKLANEVCFYADKSCIDEELTRLDSHIAHARMILASEEPVGRKLDFLLQEFNRETNTICSKSGILDLTNVALEMKNEIEKIREQIQNLE